MANLDFYAAHDDIKSIIDFLTDETDVRIFESYSDCEKDLREFRSFNDHCENFDVGIDTRGNGCSINLQLWSKSITKNSGIRRFELKPHKCRGHAYRYAIEGPGLTQLHLGGVCEQAISHSHYGHFNQKRITHSKNANEIDLIAMKKNK